MNTQRPEVYDSINFEYSICTAPRVGSFYLQDRILQHTGVYVKKYHSFKKNKMITIVRDPIDMLTSKIAMTAFYDKNNQTLDHIRNSDDHIKDFQIYVNSIQEVDIEKDFEIIVDYRDLINRPFETTKTLANVMNLPIINTEYKENSIREYPENSHLISSKKVAEYEEIQEYVKTLKLFDLYDFYNKALTKCIKIQ
jgi:hypothetical protein